VVDCAGQAIACAVFRCDGRCASRTRWWTAWTDRERL